MSTRPTRARRLIGALRMTTTGPYTLITDGWCAPDKAGALMSLGTFTKCVWCESSPILGVAWQTIDGARTELLVCRQHVTKAGEWLAGQKFQTDSAE